MMNRTLTLVLLAIAAVWLAACSSAAAPPATVVQPEKNTPRPEETNTSIPTLTAVPSPTQEPGKVLLVAPPDGDHQALAGWLAAKSAAAGLVFETRAVLAPEELGESARVVIFLLPPENLSALTAAARQTQFAVVSAVDLPTGANLSVIRSQPELQALWGGFIAVLLSTDWRAGGLLPADGPLAEPARDAFVNGGRYYCGICAPGWPLGVRYPQAALIGVGSDGAAVQSMAAELFETQKVEAFYLSAAAARPEVYAYLQGREQFGQPVLLIGEQAPPAELLPQWAATVAFDLAAAFEQLWPDLLDGRGGKQLAAPLVLQDVNLDNLGAGRLRLVEEFRAEIEAGMVHPFSVPEE